MNPRALEVIRFDKPLSYSDGYALQTQRRSEIEAGSQKNALFLLEHTPTFTLGRSADRANLLANQETLTQFGIEVTDVDRGGDITYHGPGQLVAYPVLNLEEWEKTIQWYLRSLEEVIINTLAQYDLSGERLDNFTGIWINGAKIAAVGIGIHQWVTYHGISINLHPNMDHWKLIVPCGIPDKPVTSLQTLLESPPAMPHLMETFESCFKDTFS